MSKIAIIYKSTDVRGRQVLEARSVVGDVLHTCRHVKSLVKFLVKSGRKAQVFDDLPVNQQQELIEYRSAVEAEHRTAGPARPRMGDLFGDVLTQARKSLEVVL